MQGVATLAGGQGGDGRGEYMRGVRSLVRSVTTTMHDECSQKKSARRHTSAAGSVRLSLQKGGEDAASAGLFFQFVLREVRRLGTT